MTPRRITTLKGKHFHQWVRRQACNVVIGEIGQEVQYTLLETWLRDSGFQATVSLMGEVEIDGKLLYLNTGAMNFSMCYQECGGKEEMIQGTRPVTSHDVMPYMVYIPAEQYLIAR